MKKNKKVAITLSMLLLITLSMLLLVTSVFSALPNEESNTSEGISKNATTIKSGQIGTVDWILDDTGVLTFGGGVFSDGFSWSNWSTTNGLKSEVITVNFTAPITAGNSLSYMFSGFTKLASINGMTNLDTSKVANMAGMFNQCGGLTSLDVSNFNTSNVTNMMAMFQQCVSLTSLDITGFNTSKVTLMSSMFNGSTALTSLDVTNFDTANVTNMSFMFVGFQGATLDLSSFNTSKVTNMQYMFYRAQLTNIDLSKFETSKVTNMNSMFRECSKLTALDINTFNTSNVTDMEYMFFSCSSLTSLNVNNFNTTKVTTMNSMLRECPQLVTLNISSFDTSSVTDMYYIFLNSKFEELTLGANTKLKARNNLPAPTADETYTGKWQFVGTGTVQEPNGEAIENYLLMDYNGTQPGTYVWEKNTYSVTFYAEGGTEVPSQTVVVYGKVTSPEEPTREGYTFVGWHKDAIFVNEWNFDNDIMPAANLELHAQWLPNNYEVTFDTNGGSSLYNITASTDMSLTAPEEPTRSGYTFAGWYKDSSFEKKWNFASDVMPPNDMTLYAKWRLVNVEKPVVAKPGINPLTGDMMNLELLGVAMACLAGLIIILFVKKHKEK